MNFYKKSYVKFVIVNAILIFIISCSKPKTEEQLFEEMKSGFQFKTYTMLSKTTVPPIVSLYNSQRDKDMPEIKEEVVRILLAYSLAVSQSATCAIAEASLIKDPEDEKMKFLAQSVIAIALYEKGWRKIAFQQSEKANSYLKKNPGKSALEEVITFHLVMGSMCIYTNNLRAARFHFAGFSNATQIHWPYQIFDALVDITENEFQKGLIKLKKISEDETVPEEVREIVASGIKEIEKDTGPVDSKLFWPRAVSKILFKELKKIGNASFSKVSEIVEEISSKLGEK